MYLKCSKWVLKYIVKARNELGHLGVDLKYVHLYWECIITQSELLPGFNKIAKN